MRTPRAGRVLSIQSHVVSGYVGNKAACFPLQLLGFEVDVMNSCMLANHTGYLRGAAGPRTTAYEISAILHGLEANHLLSPVTHLLTGYAANTEVLEAIVMAYDMIRRAHQDSDDSLVYVCDPVLGDNGKLYVSEKLVPIYRDQILPLATVLTPNCFELSLLASVGPIENEQQAFAACRKLHETVHIPTIIVTGVLFSEKPSSVSMLVSESSGERFALDAERLQSQFTGSGDLTAALILAWRELRPNDQRDALRRAMASVSSVLARTLSAKNEAERSCPFPELQLIQSIDDIRNPPIDLIRIREVL